MAITKLFLLVVWLAVCVGMCRPWGDVVEDAKAKAEEAKQGATAAMHDAKEMTESWADRAHDKFSQSFGVEHDNEKQVAQDMKYKAGDAASRATEIMKSAASGASEYASQKATDAREAISGAMAYGREKAAEAYDGDDKIRMPTDRATDAKDTMGEVMDHARERMADTHDDAKQKVYMASDKASTMAHNAKDNIAESMGYGRERAADVYNQGRQKINMASDVASEKFYDAKDTRAGAMGYAKDIASDAYDETRHKISHMASGNAYDEAKQRIKMASQIAYGAKEKVKEAMEYGRDKAADAYDEAKERINMASNISGDKAYDAKDKVGGAMGYERDKVADTFDQAKHEVGEHYISAKNTMTREAKAKYEAAKEKVSQATGDLGAKMRKDSPEL